MGVDVSVVVIESVIFKKASRRHLASDSGDMEVRISILADVDDTRLSEVTPSRLREKGVARARRVEVEVEIKVEVDIKVEVLPSGERRWYATETFFLGVGIGCAVFVLGGATYGKARLRGSRSDTAGDAAEEENSPQGVCEEYRKERCAKVFPSPPRSPNAT